MAIYQIFVKLLDGRTQCFQISSPTISGETIKQILYGKTKISVGFQRLVTGSREISDKTLISASADGVFPSLNLLLRIPGGKGGFGSLLRGAATKAGQKKTNNFDACRDMSGRRLRHVNAEKKLEEWKAEAGERKLEKLAEQFLKKKAKEVKKNSSAGVDKYLEKYRVDSEKCMEEVEESVRQSFELYRDSKRKILPTSGPSKRLKMWLGKEKVDESDSDDADDEEEDDDVGSDGRREKSVVLDDGNFLSRSKEDEGCSAVTLVSSANSEGESSGCGSEQSNLEQVNGKSPDGESSGGGSGHSDVDEVNGNCDRGSPAMGGLSGTGDSNSELDTSFETGMDIPEVAAAQNSVVSSLEEVPERLDIKLAAESHVQLELVDQTTDNSALEEPLNFDKYNSAAELEVLGMERLKSELQARGLKCGGTLQERAARLFLLKTTPLEKLPKKVLAKPSSGVVGGK